MAGMPSALRYMNNSEGALGIMRPTSGSTRLPPAGMWRDGADTGAEIPAGAFVPLDTVRAVGPREQRPSSSEAVTVLKKPV